MTLTRPKSKILKPAFTLCAITLSISLVGCSTGPIIDPQGVDQAQYQADLKDCEAIADQVGTGKQAAKSAAFGALVGAAFGAITGDAGQGAAIGGVTGATSGSGQADQEKSTVIKNCLRNRGYTVLN